MKGGDSTLCDGEVFLLCADEGHIWKDGLQAVSAYNMSTGLIPSEKKRTELR